MKINVIKYKSNAYYEVLELRKEILRKPLGLKFSKEDLALEFDQIHIAYFKENEIVAGLILVPSENGKIKMRQVCVATKMQGKEIGKELVLFAENWANENQYSEMYCHARKNALAFYKKLDYELVGDVFIEVGLEHYKLVKKLI
ncbi:MAG: GNAT family N-acetyltransferase [Chitinophagales bacterium]